MCTRLPFIALGLLLAIGVSSLAHAAQREVLIWGGGKTPREAAALQAKLTAPPGQLPSRMKLAPGFPTTLESRTLSGLKPGFHIVLLGFCSKAEVGPVLAELKSLNPGAYARTVTVPEGPYESACPRLEPWPKPEAPEVIGALRKGAKVKPKQQVKVVGLSKVDEATGRFAALVELSGEEGATLVGLTLAGAVPGAKVLGLTPVTAEEGGKPELRRELFRIAPRETAAAVTSTFKKEQEDPSGDTYVAEERTRMEVLHLSEEGPRSVLEFTVFEAERNVECDKTTEAEYGPVEGKLHQGFHPFRVATVTTDQCAIAYWQPEGEDAERPEDLGITREEEVHTWDGTSY
jgi:hypothetical protein